VLQHRDEPQLTLWRERCLGLVEQVQPPRYEPRAKQLEKALAVGIRVEVHTIPPLEICKRARGRNGREAARPRGTMGVLDVDLGEPRLQLRAQAGEVLGESKKVFRAQEESLVRSARPGESQLLGQRALCYQRLVVANRLAANSWQPHRRREAPHAGSR